MEPGSLSDNIGPVAEMMRDVPEQRIVLLFIDRSHPPHMPIPVPLLHEFYKGSLIQMRNRGKIILEKFAVRGYECMRKHHEAHAECRRQDLGEGSAIDDIPMRAQPVTNTRFLGQRQLRRVLVERRNEIPAARFAAESFPDRTCSLI